MMLKLEVFEIEVEEGSSRTVVLDTLALEETKLASYEAGYAAGWEDAMAAQSDEQTQIRADLARDRSEQRPERFQVGDKVDVRVTNIDSKSRRLGLSIKAREIAEEKEAVEQYGSSDSGASLGDILGAALKSDD